MKNPIIKTRDKFDTCNKGLRRQLKYLRSRWDATKLVILQEKKKSLP
ncbi:hypothetical protein [Nonlabens antarcticus]|nr:hypothetical protein [Nonlabens antarcticus]